MANVSAVVEEMKSLGEQESQMEKLNRKLNENPFVGHGMFALAAVCAAGAYGFKRRSIPAGFYLMQMRVLAQGALVGGLASAVGLNLLRNLRPRRLAVQPKVVWW